MVEWWNGGMVEWWNGGMVEWWNGGMVDNICVLKFGFMIKRFYG